jgi:hypothetical protein
LHDDSMLDALVHGLREVYGRYAGLKVA